MNLRMLRLVADLLYQDLRLPSACPEAPVPIS